MARNPLRLVALVLLVALGAACDGDAAPTTTTTSATATTTTIGVAVTGTVVPTYSVGSGVAEDVATRIRETLDALRTETEVLRGLVFLDPPRVSMLAEDDFAARHGAFLESRLDPDSLATETSVLRMMGLLGSSDDLRTLLLEVSDRPVAAFYDPAVREVVVAGGDADLDPVARTDVVRAFALALTDQYHLVADRVAGLAAEGRNDEATALEALWTADANYTQLIHTQALDEEDQSAIAAAAPAPPGVPAYLEEQLRLSGETGLAFVTALMEEGGTRAVDDVYAADLFTTEHLMHPPRYLGGEQLQAITPVAAHPGGVSVAAAGSLGEGTLRSLLAQALRDDILTQTADGWGSDESAIYTSPDTLALVYTMRADSVDDAVEVAAGFLTHAETVMGMSGAIDSGGGLEYVGSARSAGDYVFVDRIDDGLVVVIADDVATGRQLAETVSVP